MPRALPAARSAQVLLQTSPYHVDSLLQLSDACRFQEDQEMARDLVGEPRSHPAAPGPKSLLRRVAEASGPNAVSRGDGIQTGLPDYS